MSSSLSSGVLVFSVAAAVLTGAVTALLLRTTGLGRRTAAVVAGACLVAAGLYGVLGDPGQPGAPYATRDPGAEMAAMFTTATAEERRAWTQALAARLERYPDDPQSWLLLVGLYRAAGQPDKARAASRRALAALEPPSLSPAAGPQATPQAAPMPGATGADAAPMPGAAGAAGAAASGKAMP